MNENNKIYFWPQAACFYDDAMWFIYGYYGALCKSNLKTWDTEIIGELPSNKKMQSDAFTKIIPYKKFLYLIPWWGDDLLIYDIEKEKYTEIRLEQDGKSRFNNAFLESNEIICLPVAYKSILRINVQNQEVVEEYDMRAFMRKYSINYFNCSARIDNGTYAMVSPESDKIFIYDSNTKSMSTIETDKQNRYFESVVFLGNILFLCSNNAKEIVLFNWDTQKVEKIWWPEGKERVVLRRLNNYLLIDDCNSAWVALYDLDLSQICEYDTEVIRLRSIYYYYLVGKNIDGSGFYGYFNNADASLLLLENDTLKSVKLEMDNDEHMWISDMCEMEMKDKLIAESELLDLNYYIKKICE